MNQTFTNLLLWLAAIDSTFMVSQNFFLIRLLNQFLFYQILVNLTFSLPSLSPSYKALVFPLILPSLLPLTSVSMSASVYCVIALAVERYLHIARHQASNKVGADQNKLYFLTWYFQGSFFGYILPVMAFSLLYNAPKFFEFTTVYTTDKNRWIDITWLRILKRQRLRFEIQHQSFPSYKIYAGKTQQMI